MPRFEILYHAICDMDCNSSEEAAAAFRDGLAGSGDDRSQVFHLAVWREDADAASSPLDAAARSQLDLFFTEVLRCAQEAEDRFRGDVEAILQDRLSQDMADQRTDR